MELPAGVPALTTLVACACTGALVGWAMARPTERSVATVSSAIGLPSAVFWLWAIQRTVAGVPDLGCISFPVAICGAYLCHPRARLCLKPSRRVALWSIGCGIVTVNFAIGVAIVAFVQGVNMDRVFLLVYYICGTLYWACLLYTSPSPRD